MNKNFEPYTDEEIKYLFSVADKYDTLGKIADDFINHFGNKRTRVALCRKCRLIGIVKKNITQFKKEPRPETQCPIGTERTVCGQVFIKASNISILESEKPHEAYHKNWKLKARYIYEKNYGEIPRGYRIVFLDGNQFNFGIENLYMVSDKVGMIMVNNNWFTNSKIHNLTAIKWCELFYVTKGL